MTEELSHERARPVFVDLPRRGGWLTLLSVLLLVWGPLDFGLRFSLALEALSIRGLPLGLILSFDLVATATGVAAGLALFARRSIGIALAKAALAVGAAVDLVRYTTPYMPNNHMPGETPWYLVASLLYHAAWLTYLVRSTRARALQSDEPTSSSQSG